ncbi:hypothetical protein SUDANB180_00716 [Streptomyces sp. enrichment culture]
MTVLPDFSVCGEPLERQGLITFRPIAADATGVLLMLQRRKTQSEPQAARDPHEMFVRTARKLGGRLTGACSQPVASGPSPH